MRRLLNWFKRRWIMAQLDITAKEVAAVEAHLERRWRVGERECLVEYRDIVTAEHERLLRKLYRCRITRDFK